MKFIKTMCLVLSVMILFSACSTIDGTTNNEIQLTTDNASQYLNFSIKGGGDGADYSSMYGIGYENIAVNGTITGIAGYTYNNVTITMKFSFTYEDWSGGQDSYGGDYTQSITQDIALNVGGSGNVSASERIQLEPYHYVGHWSNVECQGYEIVDITGTVTQN